MSRDKSVNSTQSRMFMERVFRRLHKRGFSGPDIAQVWGIHIKTVQSIFRRRRYVW